MKLVTFSIYLGIIGLLLIMSAAFNISHLSLDTLSYQQFTMSMYHCGVVAGFGFACIILGFFVMTFGSKLKQNDRI